MLSCGQRALATYRPSIKATVEDRRVARGQLQQLSTDWEGIAARGVDALTDGALLHFLTADDRRGLLLQRHDTQPAHAAQTSGGLRLLELCAVMPT